MNDSRKRVCRVAMPMGCEFSPIGPLPDGTRIVGYYEDPGLHVRYILLQSDAFHVVPEGELFPIWKQPPPPEPNYEFLPAAHGNFRVGRKVPISHVVIHCTDGSFGGAVSWFQNPMSKVSSHYVISKGGRVVQMVKEEDTAFHAGVRHPLLPTLIPPGNPNEWSIGIEFAAMANEHWTDEQYESGIRLLVDIAKRNPLVGFAVGDNKVLGHGLINIKKKCPGLGNVDRLIGGAREIQEGVVA